MVRAFLAIDLPKDLKKDLYSHVQIPLPEGVKIKWVEEENLHITLKFFGHIKENLISKIQRACERALETYPPFLVSLANLGTFPEKGTPRVIWLGLEDQDKKIYSLEESLRKALRPLKLNEEKEAFHPHITLLRVKGIEDFEAFQGFLEGLREKVRPFLAKSFWVREVVLFKSELHHKGPKYTPLAKIPLKG